MKKSTFITPFFALAALTAGAQLAEVGTPQPLLRGVQSDLYNPVLSRDGSRLLFSSADYSNLRMYDFNDNVTVSVCKDARSGFDAQFTPDASAVVFVSQRTAENGMNMRRVQTYDVESRRLEAISEETRAVERPLVGNGSVQITDTKGRRTVGRKAVDGVRTSGSVLYITVGGVESAYTPVPSQAGYIWASLSPSGKKVMFFAAGRGIVITDLKGNVLSEPGKYEAPVWFGDDHIVAMNATDDGHQFRSSQIVLLKADGSEMQELTRPESMSMNPTASIQGGKIVYNTIDGLLYQMDVRLK